MASRGVAIHRYYCTLVVKIYNAAWGSLEAFTVSIAAPVEAENHRHAQRSL